MMIYASVVFLCLFNYFESFCRCILCICGCFGPLLPSLCSHVVYLCGSCHSCCEFLCSCFALCGRLGPIVDFLCLFIFFGFLCGHSNLLVQGAPAW